MRDFLFMLLILLIPLIPAFVLFKYLPESRADVDGPLKGLNIKLSGAFAGYIVGVLLSWQVATSLLEPSWCDIWGVMAQVKFDGAPAQGPPIGQVIVIVHPPTPDLDSDGMLRMKVAIPRLPGGAIETPTLIVSYEGYQTANVPLDPDSKHLGAYGGKDYQVTFDHKKHEILVKQAIVLAKARN
jgi:hypothetical protein